MEKKNVISKEKEISCLEKKLMPTLLFHGRCSSTLLERTKMYIHTYMYTFGYLCYRSVRQTSTLSWKKRNATSMHEDLTSAKHENNSRSLRRKVKGDRSIENFSFSYLVTSSVEDQSFLLEKMNEYWIYLNCNKNLINNQL